jgi:hypothetical protein
MFFNPSQRKVREFIKEDQNGAQTQNWLAKGEEAQDLNI